MRAMHYSRAKLLSGTLAVFFLLALLGGEADAQRRPLPPRVPTPTPTRTAAPTPAISPRGGQPPGGFPPERAYPLTNPLGSRNLLQVIDDFGSALNLIAIPLVAILVTIGALQMLTAAGNSEKFAKGKQTLLYTVIGYGIVVVAKGITAIIRQIFQ